MTKRSRKVPLLPIAVLDRLHDALVVTDTELDEPGPRILYANPAFTRMTGYANDELLGKTPRLLQGAETDRRVLKRLRRCLETGERFVGETVNYRKDGTPFQMQWTVEPVRNTRGKVTAYFAIQRDVSKHAETPTTAAPSTDDLVATHKTVQRSIHGQHGAIEGLTLAGFAQLLEVERKTCRLTVTHGERRGVLAFRDGILADASMGELQGNQAALAILSWSEDARLHLRMVAEQKQVTVTESLRELLFESMRLKDEAAAQKSGNEFPDTAPLDTNTIVRDRAGYSVRAAMMIDGAIGVALLDADSGDILAQSGGDAFRLDVAGPGNVDVLREKQHVVETLGLDDGIEDILITLTTQYHLIRPLAQVHGYFLYLVLDRGRANLAMARRQLAGIEETLSVRTDAEPQSPPASQSVVA